MGDIEIREENGIDEVRYLPQGVCSKLMNIKIKDGIVIDIETVGGCSGNLKGIGSLILGMKVEDIINKLQGIPCGSRPTSCPDQLAKALNAYAETKQKQHAGV